MLHELEIQGFRCFPSLTAKPLGRVNLLVGKNNAGKTAFLDAVELLMSFGPGLRWASLLRRKESSRHTVENEQTGSLVSELYVYPLNFFHGYQFVQDQTCVISSHDSKIEMSCGILPLGNYKRPTINVNRVGFPFSSGSSSYDMDLGGAHRLHYVKENEEFFDRFVRFLPTTRMDTHDMTALWDEVQAMDEDNLVLDALKYIDPNVARLLARGEGDQRRFWVRLRGQSDLVRLSSVGDGMRHILALALNVAMSGDGYLLIDEIDTGLHFSVMTKMWRMLIESAKRLNVQIFATTHSMDCIQALAEVHQQMKLTTEDLMLHRLVAGMDKTTGYTPDELVAVAEFQGEVR